MKPPQAIKRLLALCISASLIFGSATGLAAPPGDGAFEAGAKSFAVKKAVQVVAQVIRSWGPEITKVTRTMDAKALKWFSKRASKIADELDEIAEIPDLVPTIVKEKILYYLVSVLRVDGGSANVIAQAIEGAIYLFL